jgi:hypothetical protein
VRGTPLPSASMSTLSPHIPEDRHSVLHASEVGTVGGRGIELAEREIGDIDERLRLASGFLLCTPLLSRDWHTGRMDEICFDPSCPQPTRQPEAIAAGFEGHNDALDLAAGVDRFVTPAMQ